MVEMVEVIGKQSPVTSQLWLVPLLLHFWRWRLLTDVLRKATRRSSLLFNNKLDVYFLHICLKICEPEVKAVCRNLLKKKKSIRLFSLLIFHSKSLILEQWSRVFVLDCSLHTLWYSGDTLLAHSFLRINTVNEKPWMTFSFFFR